MVYDPLTMPIHAKGIPLGKDSMGKASFKGVPGTFGIANNRLSLKGYINPQ